MSEKIEFRGGTSHVLREEFVERQKYRDSVSFPGMIDTLYDNMSYGLINSNFEPVYLVNEPEILSSFSPVATSVSCLGFVVDAFFNFRRDYLERVANTNTKIPVFLEGLTPKLGYVPLEESYHRYMIFSAVKYSSFLENNKSVNDLNCFLDALKLLFRKNLGKFPVTRSGFILSKQSTPRTSGLSIELAKLDYNVDIEKGEILQSRDFLCFASYAKNNGFYIDKYSPWRLYANIDHPTMKQIIRRNANSTLSAGEVLDVAYRLRSHKDDLWDLQDFVLKTYNDIKKRVPFFSESEYNSTSNEMVESIVFRPEAGILKSSEWVDLLLYVRLLELGKYEIADYERYKLSVLSTDRYYGTGAAVDHIGQICSSLIREEYERQRNNSAPG